MALSYTTPKRTRQIVEVQFELDGETYTARKPKDAIMVYLAAATSDQATDADRLYATLQFINGCLTISGQHRIQSRLRDYDDDLELDDLVPLMEDLAAEFGDGDAKPSGRKAGAGKVITPDGEEATVINAATLPNRAAKRAAKKAPAKAAKAPVRKTIVSGRALPR